MSRKLLGISVAALFVAFAAFAHEMEPTTGKAAPSAGTKLTRVEAKKVCMINEVSSEKDQIAVTVDGKTYYGCCAMCTKKLQNDASTRTAIDPVSHENVDKADAVIAADAEGHVYYFSSEKNLDTWNSETEAPQK